MANGRCKHHGGFAKGGYFGQPIHQAHAALRRSQARMKALGLPWYGGRPRKLGKVQAMAERAKTQLEVALAEYGIAGPGEHAGSLEVIAGPKPVTAMSAAEALGATSLKGLQRLYEIVCEPLNPEDLKQRRLVADVAIAANKLFMQAAEGQFRQRRDDAVVELLERLALERAKDGKG